MGLGDDMVEAEATREELERCVRLLVGRASFSTHPIDALSLAALIAGGSEAYRALASTGGLGWATAVTELEKHCTSRFSHDQSEEMKKHSIKGEIADTGELEAGLELDMAIATRVMGLVVVPDPVNKRGVSIGEAGWKGADLKSYSTSIAAAWEIVEKLKATSSRGYVLDFLRGEWTVGLRVCGDAGEPELYGHGAGRAEEAPLAICRAALKEAL